MRDMVQVRRQGGQSYKGPDAKIGRSQFNRSHGLKMTFDGSYLVPFLVDDVLPGDTMTMKLNGFARIFSPLKSPIMDNIVLETFFFFVPNRLVWEHWVDFQGEHDAAGAQDTDYTIPIINDLLVDHDNAYDGHGLAAFMGLPEALDSSLIDVSAIPFRCYARIFNEWFRDQNLKSPVTMDIDDGPDAVGAHAVRKSNKKHDYFTSCLPFTQKGDEITVSLGATADIWSDAAFGADLSYWDTVTGRYEKFDATQTYLEPSNVDAVSGTNKLYANLAGAAGISINALREAVSIQRLLERDSRGGTRYVESIKAHLGVASPDFRLQRPEYLGGGKSFINISPVANTSDTTAARQGELAAIGTGIISGHGWAKSFTEHGTIMGLIRARGDLTYFQGLDRMWSRSTRYDFYIPALANLGEQAVLNKEIFVSNDANDDLVFGYQERWSEYRMKMSRVVGTFNPDVGGGLAHWHLAEDFSTLPALNNTFMQDATPMARIVASTDEPDFILDMWFDYKCARPLPVFSVPGLTSRF